MLSLRVSWYASRRSAPLRQKPAWGFWLVQIESVFGLAARQADVAHGAGAWFRAGERKTDWSKPRAARLSYGRWMRPISVRAARCAGPRTPRGPLPWQDWAWPGPRRCLAGGLSSRWRL